MGLTLWDYYRHVAKCVTRDALEAITTLEEWQAQREERLRQFRAMMGLEPVPERCDLSPKVFGQFAGEGYRAEKVGYQILPEVHASANLYRPDPLPAGKLPAVLYLCGHHTVGVHAYQAHGAMWARRGYVCLVLDTIEQHDNRGDHHSLYYGKRPDWVSRGYTPAGGELWNSMRALDLLLSLPEVDSSRVGTTGLSGGGAHSFFLAAADERIACAAPLCGVDTLEYFIGGRHWLHHCDCMYPYNIFQQDSSEWAALVAPRPLLLCFAREDSLFSPAGYKVLFDKARRIYSLHGAGDMCKLFEYPGPHGYRPEAVEEVNRWFDQHLAGGEQKMLGLGELLHDEKTTTVFNGAVPECDRLDVLPELLTRRGSIVLPDSVAQLGKLRNRVTAELLRAPLSWLARCEERLQVEQVGDYLDGERRHLLYEGDIAGANVWIEMTLPAQPTGKVVVGLVAPGQTTLDLWGALVGHCGGHAAVTVEARAAGLAGYDRSNPGTCTHMLRAGTFVGITETMLGIQDLGLALAFLRELPELAGQPRSTPNSGGSVERGQQLYLYGRGEAGVACLYAALLDDGVAGVVADSIVSTHLEGAHIPGILATLDIPQLIGMIAPRPVGLVSFGFVRSFWADRLYARLGCSERLVQGELPAVMRNILAQEAR